MFARRYAPVRSSVVLGKRKSYDELPALSVRRGELRVSLRRVIVAWLFCVLFVVFCRQASHVVVYFNMVGFTDFHFGVFGALAFVPRIFQFVATVLIERTGLRKYLFIHALTVSRLSWLAIAAVPLILPLPSAAAVAAVLVLWGISQTFQALGEPAWMTWMGDLIPRRVRGRFLGHRRRLGIFVQLLAFAGAGLLVDAVTVLTRPETAAGQPTMLWIITALLAVGALSGTADILLFRRIREIRRPKGEQYEAPVLDIRLGPRGRGLLATLRHGFGWLRAAGDELLVTPLRDRAFRGFTLYGVFGMAIHMSVGVFFMRNALENLGYSKFGANVLFIGVGGLMGVFSSRLWGRAIDRWGNRQVLMLGSAGTMCSALPWFFVTKDTPAPAFLVDGLNGLAAGIGGWFGHSDWIWITPDVPLGAYLGGTVSCCIGGVCWAGVHLAREGVTMGFADGAGRSKYVAAMSVMFGIGGTLGGLLGGGLASLLAGHSISVGPFFWRNWHAVFLFSILARATGVAILSRMPDPGGRSFQDMTRGMRDQIRRSVANGLYYPRRVFSWWPRTRARGKDERRDR